MDFYLQQGLHSRKQSGLSAVNVSLVRQFEAPTTTAQVVAAVTSLPPSPTRMPRFVAPLPGSRPTSSKDPSQTTHTPLTPPPSHPSLRRTPPPVYGALNNAPPPATPIPAMPSPAVPRLGGSITVLDTPNPEESPAIQPPQIIVEGDSSESLDSPVILPTEIADEEEELSEQQLRELYDEEEMERFLHMFSTVCNIIVRAHESSSTYFYDSTSGKSGCQNNPAGHRNRIWWWRRICPRVPRTSNSRSLSRPTRTETGCPCTRRMTQLPLHFRLARYIMNTCPSVLPWSVQRVGGMS